MVKAWSFAEQNSESNLTKSDWIAVIGAHALGEHGSLAEAARTLARIGKTFSPVRENAERYGNLFAGYRECLDR
ncbi:MAG: hypothetical protein FWD94_01540 [Treponema sp.]|nr:hypothetical protein [Treponema sp.]